MQNILLKNIKYIYFLDLKQNQQAENREKIILF